MVYRHIDFSTEYVDESGRKYFKPPTYSIADFLCKQFLADFKIDVEKYFTSIYVYLTPIYQQASLFQAEKRGEKKLIGIFCYNPEKDKITLLKKYERQKDNQEVSIPELLFSCLRPTDIVEITLKELNFNNEICTAKYTNTKSALNQNTRIIQVKDSIDERFIAKSLFLRKEFPAGKKGKNYGYKKNTKIYR